MDKSDALAPRFTPGMVYPQSPEQLKYLETDLLVMIEIETNGSQEVLDITLIVEQAVRKSGVENGICLIYTLHTTTAVVVNEAEPGLMRDLTAKMRELLPGGGYHHVDNGPSHLQAAVLGNSVVIPVEGRAPVLGTWQRVLFVELDGPRRRKVGVKMIPACSQMGDA